MPARRVLRLLPCLLCLIVLTPLWSAPNLYVRTIIDKGRTIDEIKVPGRPPAWRMPAVALPRVHTKSLNTLSNVPALDWCYGCSATSAAMMFGYYDNAGYPNMYSGPTNGGVFPQTNAVWGSGECPLSATHSGLDGRATRGHVDDYWIAYNNSDPDPWISNSWVQHIYGDCTADYMGTNQSSVGNTDGSTTFYYMPDHTPLSDYTASEPDKRDGCHGLRTFAQSRGYAVSANYSQYIAGYQGNSKGFTFANYKSEIDAGRPVLIQVWGHTMIGLGYDDATQTVYIHDTWDYQTHTMIWGGSYSNMQHYGVTVLHLTPLADTPPTVPTGLTITPANPDRSSALQATASGSTGSNISYKYQWVKLPAGTTLGDGTEKALTWGYDSTDGKLIGVQLAKGQVWAVHARATNGQLDSAWTTAVSIAIGNTAPVTTAVVVTPVAPRCTATITATASASDADGDTPTYSYQWRQYTGGVWGDWGHDSSDGILTGVTLVKNDKWQAQARAYDGTDYSSWMQSTAVAVTNTPPHPPVSVSVSPSHPTTVSSLRARPTGATDADGDALTYRYQWCSSSDHGATWTAWGNPGVALSASKTTRDQQWMARCRVSDGQIWSGWRLSSAITIANTPPTMPTAVSISPASPGYNDTLTPSASGSADADQDTVSYVYQWARSKDGGATWSQWGWDGPTLNATLTIKGDLWKTRARATDGTAYSPLVESAPVTIGAVPGAGLVPLTVTSSAAPTHSGTVAVTVSLSSDASVELSVCNLAGRVVAVLPAQTMAEGLTTLLWNAKSTTGTAMPTGNYLLRLTARRADGSESQSVSTLYLRR